MATQSPPADTELSQPKAAGSRRLSVAAKKKLTFLGLGALGGLGFTGTLYVGARLTAYLLSTAVPITVVGSAIAGARFSRRIANERVNARVGALLGVGAAGTLWGITAATASLISSNVPSAVLGSALLGASVAEGISLMLNNQSADKRIAERREKPPLAS